MYRPLNGGYTEVHCVKKAEVYQFTSFIPFRTNTKYTHVYPANPICYIFLFMSAMNMVALNVL
jgi:hypothetical protein